MRSAADPEAFAEVHDAFAGQLLRFFALRVVDPQTALDLTSDTLATVYEKRGTFRGTSEDEAAAWIWTIARNKLARHWRRRTVDRSAMERLGMQQVVMTDGELDRIDELLAAEAAGGAMERALAELPEGQQDVLRMRYLDELPDQMIASRLDVSEEVVRTRASRALRRLRSDPDLRAFADDEQADG